MKKEKENGVIVAPRAAADGCAADDVGLEAAPKISTPFRPCLDT